MIANHLRGTLLALLISGLLAAMPAMAQSGTNSGAATSNSPAPATTAQTASGQNSAAAPAAAQPSAASTASSNDAASPSADDQASARKYPHDGGLDDVSAIGNRKIGERGLGNWYSLDHDIAMGKSYAQQIEQSVKLVQDPVVTEYINRLGQNLVRNSDAKVPFTIKVIDTDDINAMALPGGFFYVNSGLILAADNEAELAGVMSHEIAHVAARHIARENTRGEWANIATLPLIFLGGPAGYGARAAAGLALPIGFMKFSRGFEAQADYLGVQYMYKAGYDPQAFVSIMERMENLQKKKPGAIAKVFASHPADADRVKASEKEIATILPPRSEYILDTSEFEVVKARLAALENRHKIEDKKDANRPTLRKTSADTPDGKNGDDRPVLKRRDDPQNQN